jgi:hypothetical protein
MNLNRAFSLGILLGFTLAGASLWAASISTDGSFNVSLDTSALAGTTETLAFSLTEGDAIFENTVTLSDFDFGGGSPSGTPSYVGSGVSGDLASTVTLEDTDFLELFSQTFEVGSSLSFHLETTNSFEGGAPDGFAMYLCDASFDTCYSDNLNTGALLTLNLTGIPLTTSDFTVNGASAQGLTAPAVTPEPRSLALLLAAGLATAVSLLRPRKHAPAREHAPEVRNARGEL